MPPKAEKKDYYALLQAELEVLEKMGEKLTGASSQVKTNLNAFLSSISEAGSHFRSRREVRDPSHILEKFKQSKQKMLENIRVYLEGEEKDKKVVAALTSITKTIASSTEEIEDLEKALTLSCDVIESKNDPEYENRVQEYYEKNLKDNRGFINSSIKECCTISVKENDPQDIFGRLLYLCDYTSRYTHDFETNLYQQTLHRLVAEIEEAPVGKKMEYVSMFQNYYYAMDANQKEKPAFDRLMSMFGRSDMGLMIYSHNPKLRDVNYSGYRYNPMPEKDVDDNICTIGSYYSQLLQDGETNSPTFTAVKDAMEQFITMDHDSISGNMDASYAQALDRISDTAKLFLAGYTKPQKNEKIAARITLVQNLKVAIDRRLLIAKGNLEQQKQRETNRIEEDARKNKITQVEKNLKIARLNRHIAPIKIIPKELNHSVEPSRLSKFFRGLGHFAFSAVNMIIGNTLGRLFSNLARPFTRRNVKRPLNDLDTNLIPGSDGERFPEIQLSDDPKQPIINDIRRVPLVWEKPIPGDPNLPPTVSFNFSQGREGDETSLTNGGQTGHAHVTLTYSKINPFTGKNQRYSVSVGFFPKGGFGTRNIELAQYLNGMKIPGMIQNDEDNVYAIGKEFEVNNLQINKMLLLAQRYDKDGYNAITRNCSTFAADMAKEAGLNISNIMKEVDFTFDRTKENAKQVLGIGVLGMFLAPHFTRLAKRDVLTKVGKLDLSYKNHGQEMLNAQDVKKLWSVDFNTRMRGYSPNHISESIRREKGSKLHSKQYIGEKYDDRLPTEAERLVSGVNALKDEMQRLCSVLSALGSNEEENAHAQELSQQVLVYCTAMNEALKEKVTEINSANLGRTIKTDQKVEDLYGKAYEIIREYIDGLNKIYHETYRDDQKLNINFNHMVSLLEFIQKDVTDGYARYMEKLQVIPKDRDNRVDIQTMEMPMRFSSNKGSTNIEARYTMTQAAGYIKAFGSLQLALEAEAKYDELKQHDAITGEMIKLKKAFEAANTFAQAEKSFFMGRPLSKGDIEFAFNDIPDSLEEIKCSSATHDLARTYQSEVFNRMIGNIKSIVKQVVKIEDLEKNNMPTIALYDAIEDEILRKLNTPENKEMLDNIKEALKPMTMKANPQDQRTDDKAYEAFINRKVVAELKRSMCEHYIMPAVTDEIQNMIKSSLSYNAQTMLTRLNGNFINTVRNKKLYYVGEFAKNGEMPKEKEKAMEVPNAK